MVLDFGGRALFKNSGLEQDSGRLSERWGQDGSVQRDVSASYANADGTLLTVTSGKVFYLKTVLVRSNVANQVIQLKDGGTGGSLTFSFFLSTANVQGVFVLDPPLAFLTDVFHEYTNGGGIGEGTVVYTIIGWEEGA